jgi:hypothetical protein
MVHDEAPGPESTPLRLSARSNARATTDGYFL